MVFSWKDRLTAMGPPIDVQLLSVDASNDELEQYLCEASCAARGGTPLKIYHFVGRAFAAAWRFFARSLASAAVV